MGAPKTFVVRPKGRCAVRELRMGSIDINPRALSGDGSSDRPGRAKSKCAELPVLIGPHSFRTQGAWEQRSRADRDAVEAVALNGARFLAAQVDVDTPVPQLLHGRGDAKILDAHGVIDRDQSSMFTVGT